MPGQTGAVTQGLSKLGHTFEKSYLKNEQSYKDNTEYSVLQIFPNAFSVL